MNQNETLLQSLADRSGVPVPVLRAVWLREVSTSLVAGDVSIQCQRRVRDFIANGPRALDADLWPSKAAPVVAPMGDITEFGAPTDKNGQVIDTLGARVTVLTSAAAPMSGAVVRIDGDDIIVNCGGQVHRVPAAEVCA